MNFWDHFNELRGVLFRIAIVVVSVMIVMFISMSWIFDNVILAPCHGDFPMYRFFDSITAMFSGEPVTSTVSDFNINLINYELTAPLQIHLSASFWLSLIICFPVVIYLFWTFVSPGLYPHERRGARAAFFFGNLMFYLGLVCSYFLVFPICLKFLADYRISDSIPNTISLSSYMDNFYMFNLMMGVAFELPLLAWLLGKIGILSRSFFSRYRRHAIVVLLIASAFITPTGDPFTLLLVFIPLYLLWEISAFIVPATPKEEDDETDTPAVKNDE